MGLQVGLSWEAEGCAADSPPPPPPQVMVFPGLGLSREAFLTTAEFGTQELGRPAQLRLQVYRPLGGAGGPPSQLWQLRGLGSLSALSCPLVPWPLDWSLASRWTEWSPQRPRLKLEIPRTDWVGPAWVGGSPGQPAGSVWGGVGE